ncbi:Uncharacterised protein [Mycobacteroides abscessus subsp. abscessus]|nr:Uncharacterised protein [Mycobacteroides abscessus subsp. abscessus]
MGLRRGQLTLLGLLGEVGAYRTGNGQGQGTHHRRQDGRAPRGRTEALFGLMLGTAFDRGGHRAGGPAGLGRLGRRRGAATGRPPDNLLHRTLDRRPLTRSRGRPPRPTGRGAALRIRHGSASAEPASWRARSKNGERQGLPRNGQRPRAFPRYAATGCTWPLARYAPERRS